MASAITQSRIFAHARLGLVLKQKDCGPNKGGTLIRLHLIKPQSPIGFYSQENHHACVMV